MTCVSTTGRPVIKVQRARDMKSGEIGDPKTKHSRRDVPIHPELVALLRAMYSEAKDHTGLMFPISDDRVRDVEKIPEITRQAFATAGIDAPRAHRR
ncbi:MAG: hypothetical protein FWD73_00070 [Polyangiaceae bacterium]|nr:hypothetical protein [Polyangiaceae bacterium]